MDINKLIGEEVHKIQTIVEEFNGTVLYGYHVAPLDSIDSIAKSGLKLGKRSMQGIGIYSFFDLDDAQAYANKDSSTKAIVKFELNDLSKVLIFSKTHAIEMLGEENADIITQFDKVYGGFHNFLRKYVYGNTHIMLWVDSIGGIESLKDIMREKFNKDTEMSARTILFGMFPSGFLDEIPTAIIFEGEYGLTLLVKQPEVINLVGYYINEFRQHRFILSALMNFYNGNNNIGEIIANPEFEPIREYENEINSVQDIHVLINKLDSLISKIRNNRDYEIIYNQIELLTKLTNVLNKAGISEEYDDSSPLLAAFGSPQASIS